MMSAYGPDAGRNIVVYGKGGSIDLLATVLSVGNGGATIRELSVDSGMSEIRLMQADRKIFAIKLRQAEICDKQKFESLKTQMLADAINEKINKIIDCTSKGNPELARTLWDMVGAKFEVSSTDL